MLSFRRRVALRGATVVLAVATTASACAGPSGPDDDPVPRDRDEPAAATDRARPEALAALPVTITATVDQAVSPQAFRLRPGGLLVLSSRGSFQAPDGTTSQVLLEDALVQVTGSLRTLDRAALEEEYEVDYDDEVLASFEGDDVLVAHDLVVARRGEVTLAGEVTAIRDAEEARQSRVLTLVGVALPVLVDGDVDHGIRTGDVVQVVGEVDRSTSRGGRLVLTARKVALAEPVA